MLDWLRQEIGKAPRVYALLAIVVASFLAYANSLDAGFHFDDSHHIVENPYLRDAKYIPQFFHRPDTFSALPGHHMYRPVLMTSFALNYQWGGFDPLGWRLTAIALHALVAIGVFLLVHSLSATLDQRAGDRVDLGALGAALLYAIHPVFTETVDYASARSSLLATGFVVWALLAHRRSLDARRGIALAWQVLALGLFALGFLSKEIAVVYPALLIVLVWLERRGVAAALPAIAVALLLLYVRKLVLGNAVIDFAARADAVASAQPGSGGARPILWNLFTQARVVVAYLGLFLAPVGLCIHRHVRVSESPWELGVIGGGLVIVSMLWLAFSRRRSAPLLSFALLWYLIALAPTSSIIPLNQVMNEHRLYLPGVGIAILFAFGVRRLGFVPRPAWAIAGCALLALTWSRNQDWRDPVRIWASAVEISPESSTAWNALGAQQRARGDFDAAESSFRRSLEILPGVWSPTFNLGTLALDRSVIEERPALLDEAEQWLQESLRCEPGAERSRWYLAEVWYRRGEIDRAEDEFRRLGMGSARMFEMTRYPLARLALDREAWAEARAHYEDALRIGDDPVAAILGFAQIAAKQGDTRQAEAEARRAAALRPHDHRPYTYLARLYAGTRRAIGLLVEAQRRGYRPTPRDREAIMRGDPS
ncbi:MAG: hypothetical protein AAGD14_08595 [Planctomycetota bacterium]